MSSRPAHLPLVEFSSGVYQLLLHAYPTRFRRAYGPEMAGVFLDSCLRSYRQSGAIGMIELWVITLFDLARSLIEQHSQKEAGMSNSNFTRLSGWAFIVGAVFFLPGGVGMLLWDTRYAFNWDAPGMQAVGFSAFLAPVLLAIGLLGLRARYGRETGSLARWILLGGAWSVVPWSSLGSSDNGSRRLTRCPRPIITSGHADWSWCSARCSFLV